MEYPEVEVKKWGNSFAVILPKKFMERENLKEGSKFSLARKNKTMTVGDLMKLSRSLGLSEKLKGIDTQATLKKMDKELWPENE